MEIERVKLELSVLHGRLHEAHQQRLMAHSQQQTALATTLIALLLALTPASWMALLAAVVSATLALYTQRHLRTLAADIHHHQTLIQAKQAQITHILAQLEQAAAY